METHTVYILTDSNRTYLEVGYCTDITIRLQETHFTSSGLFSHVPKLNILVYMETFHEIEKALACQHKLRRYTRMQREKLIRLKNPNWLNLCHYTGPNNNRDNKKVVVCA